MIEELELVLKALVMTLPNGNIEALFDGFPQQYNDIIK